MATLQPEAATCLPMHSGQELLRRASAQLLRQHGPMAMRTVQGALPPHKPLDTSSNTRTLQNNSTIASLADLMHSRATAMATSTPMEQRKRQASSLTISSLGLDHISKPISMQGQICKGQPIL